MIIFVRDAWLLGLAEASRRYRYRLIPELIVLACIPFIWWTLDRTPPLELYDGQIIPDEVHPGQSVRVRWHARFAGRDCPGNSQRELVLVTTADGVPANKLYPERRRARGGIFKAEPNNPFVGTVQTPPLLIPPDMPPGDATYQVTQYYYCNWWQRFLQWPIHKESPLIPFTVVAQ
jgi:hypothetical protein